MFLSYTPNITCKKHIRVCNLGAEERGIRKMEATLKTDAIAYLRPVVETSFTQEETQEAIVPDTYPDMAHVLDVSGKVIVKSKEADLGRVSLSGTILVNVLYQAEEGEGVYSLDIPIPFTGGLDAEEITDETKVHLQAALQSADARMINSRKILVRADLLVEVLGFEPSVFMSTTELEDDAGAALHVQRDELHINLVTAVHEKTFVLADDFPMPAGKPPAHEILKTRVRLVNEDVKHVGNKLIFKGYAGVSVLYKTEGTGEVFPADFTASFSQIMELEEEGAEKSFDLSFMLSNIYVETISTEGGGFGIELHLVAQAIEKAGFTPQFLADAYSTKYEVESHVTEQHLEHIDKREQITAELRESIEVTGGVMRVIDASVYLGKVHTGQEGGETKLNTAVFLSVLYVTEEGEIQGLTRRFETSSSFETRSNRIYQASALLAGDIQVLPGASGLEVRVPIEFCVASRQKLRFQAVERISWEAEHMRDIGALPSVVLYHAQGGESLWYMAKRYCSTQEQITLANNLEEGMVPYPGQLFIIPKAR